MDLKEADLMIKVGTDLTEFDKGIASMQASLGELRIATPTSGSRLLIEYALAIGTSAVFLAFCADLVIWILRWAL